MNYTLTAISFLLCFCAFAQNKPDTVYLNENWEIIKSRDSAKYYQFVKEEDQLYRIAYHDLKTGALLYTRSYKDPEFKTREGEFVDYDETGKIVKERSHYIDGKLNGIHQVYYETGELFYKEQYLDGKKHGDLMAYYKDGTLKRKESYEQGVPSFKVCYLPDGKETTYYEFITAASFSNGDTAGLKKFLSEHVVYPGEALENSIMGKVYVHFAISKTGELKDVKVKRSVHPLLDKEAIRVVKSMPDWKPATLDGETVESFFTLPIVFNLN